MSYLIIAIIFFATGFKIRGSVETVRLLRDKYYIERVVQKMFEPEVTSK